MLVVLIGVTHRLWFPVTEFPGVPMPFADDAPAWTESAATAAILIACAAVIAAPVRFRGAWFVVCGGLVGGFVLDQHRLQPWAYQSALYAAVFATMPASHARRWLIPLAASVYLYSAAGKFDYQFVHTVGQDFLRAAAVPFGGLPEWLSDSARVKAALAFPIVEFSIGLGLLWRPTRGAAGVAAILMHSCLIAILGPWNLDHSNGVLAWNAALIVQAWFLFLAPAAPATEEKRGEPEGFGRGLLAFLAKAAVLAALLLPLAERAGYWDHWQSWALYSPHNSRVEVEVHRSVIERLPAGARRHVEADRDGDGWRTLALEKWSLRSRGVPVLPQARYQLAVAVAVARRSVINREIRAVVKGVADRRTGRRETERLLGRRELEQAASSYWLSPVEAPKDLR